MLRSYQRHTVGFPPDRLADRKDGLVTTVARRPAPGARAGRRPCRRPPSGWTPAPAIGRDEVRVRVERLNLDAASFRQLATKHAATVPRCAAEVLEIVAARGKMQNPVTGSGGMLVGVVDEVGPDSPLGLRPGDRVATLVSLSLTPLLITDGLAGWDGRSEQVPAEGHAILFGRSIAARHARRPARRARDGGDGRLRRAGADRPGRRRLRAAARSRSSAVRARAARSSLAAARRAGARATVGIVPVQREADAAAARSAWPTSSPSPTHATRWPWPRPSSRRSGVPADVTVVCVDVPGCEHGADPVDRRRRHGDLLLDGDVVLRGGARRRGARGRRHDADRERLPAGACRPRAGPAAHRARRTRAVRAAAGPRAG